MSPINDGALGIFPRKLLSVTVVKMAKDIIRPAENVWQERRGATYNVFDSRLEVQLQLSRTFNN